MCTHSTSSSSSMAGSHSQTRGDIVSGLLVQSHVQHLPQPQKAAGIQRLSPAPTGSAGTAPQCQLGAGCHSRDLSTHPQSTAEHLSFPSLGQAALTKAMNISDWGGGGGKHPNSSSLFCAPIPSSQRKEQSQGAVMDAEEGGRAAG